MEEKNMKILERHEDYLDWEKLIQHCETIDGFTDLEKEGAKRAFRLLKEEFGNDFLKCAFANYHPIRHYIVNLAPWTRRWVIWLAEAIKELKDQENYPNLLSRLKDDEKFGEGVSVLESAYKLSKAGFNISFDPLIDSLGRTKSPDLKLIDKDTKEELFVEVSVLGESKIARDASQTMQRIIEPLWWSVPFMHYCGRIYKTLSEKHLAHIVKNLDEIVEKVKRENIFQNLVIEDVIEMGIAPENDKQFLEKWATERGLKVGEFSGPPFDVDEILRTKRKIENEQKQLPSNHPNILIIRNNNLFFHVRDIRKTINELEEAVYEYPHLLVVVIAGGYMGSGENVITMKDQHVFIKKTKADLFVEQYIILFNQFCGLKISPSTITKVYNSFRSY
ncbi:MAG: hypothetical protein AB1566_05510 [Chloroflexota bacterium]